jgi:Tfp pilus assembly protein PilP
MGSIALLVVLTMLGAAPQPPSQPGSPASAPPTSPAKPATAPQGAPAGQAKPATPAPSPAPQTPPPAAQPPAPQPPPVETYTYRAEGRRDPFQTLIGSSNAAATSRKGEGPSGMTLAEISIRGIMQSRGALVAMIQGPDNRTYIVHSGDKLLDGTIKAIMPTGLIVVQEVNDPLSLVKQREVRKLLRSLEDAKE